MAQQLGGQHRTDPEDLGQGGAVLANRSADAARKLNPALQSFEQFVGKQKAAIKTAMGV